VRRIGRMRPRKRITLQNLLHPAALNTLRFDQAWSKIENLRQDRSLHATRGARVLNLIAHAAGDDDGQDAGVGQTAKSVNQSVAVAAITIESVGIKTDVDPSWVERSPSAAEWNASAHWQHSRVADGKHSKPAAIEA
jgi:hypothetical protein